MDEEFRDVSGQHEVSHWQHNPEALLTCIRVLCWYLGDGKARWCLPHYSWKMASRVLGLGGHKHKWSAPHWWRGRLKLYGINPETFRIEDEKLFGIAWEMLNEYCERGQPWQISVRDFKDRLKEVEQGKREWHRASIVLIPWTHKRKKRARIESRERIVATKQSAASNMMKQRIADFRREFDEQ